MKLASVGGGKSPLDVAQAEVRKQKNLLDQQVEKVLKLRQQLGEAEAKSTSIPMHSSNIVQVVSEVHPQPSAFT